MGARRARFAEAKGPTQAYRFATGLAEASYLTALAIVPLYFNPRTERVFEPDKLAWILVLSLIALWAMAVRWAERPGRAVARPQPIVAAACLAIGALVAGATLSVVPIVSWWGLYERGQGVLAYVSFAVLFLAVYKIARGPAAWERLARVALLAAVPVALYAILQRLGIDNVVWSADAAEPTHRPFGPLGNPIFLGAYLMMVLPIAFGELLSALDERHRVARSSVRIAGLCIVITLAGAALILSQSRGPVLGLLVAAGMFGLLWAAAEGRRRAVLGLVGASSALLLVLLALAASGAESMGRLGQILAVGSRTARERLLVWDALGDLMASDAVRAVIGHGPETTGFVVARYLPADLVRLAPDQVYDRAHNIVWEWWVSAGVVGALAILLVHAAALFTAFRVLGLVGGRREGITLSAAMGAGTAMGLVCPLLVPGAAAYAAVGAPLGLLAGAAAYAVGRTIRHPAEQGARVKRRGLGRRGWTAIGLAAVVSAHLVEGSLGLPTASSELIFWVSLGALAGIGAMVGKGQEPSAEGSSAEPDGREETGTERTARRNGPRQPLGARRSLGDATIWTDGLLSGLVMAAAVFAPILVAARTTPLGHPAVWLLLIVTWVCADLLRAPAEGPAWIGPAARLLVMSGLVALLLPLGGRPGGEIVAFALVLVVTTFAVGWVLSVRLSAARTGEPWRWVLYAAVALLAAVGAWRFALTPTMADTRIRTGLRHVASGDLESAQAQFELAVSMWPAQPEYATYVAAVYHEQMRRALGDRSEADAYYSAASRALTDAYAQAPKPEHMLRLALLHRDRGDRDANPYARLEVWELSRGAFETALRQAPLSPEAMAEHAGLLERLGDVAAAREAYVEAVDIGGPNAYWLAGLARTVLADGDLPAGEDAITRLMSLSGFDTEQAERVLGYPANLPVPLPGYAESWIVYLSLAGRRTEARELYDRWASEAEDGEMRDAVGAWLGREGGT